MKPHQIAGIRIWTLVTFNPILTPCSALKSEQRALTSLQSFAAGGVHGCHDGISERLRMQVDLRGPFSRDDPPGKAPTAHPKLSISVPASIARRMASRVHGNPPARILCTTQETPMDMAAFANTCLVRYLDCNDAYAARATGHPSDMIPGVLAVAGGHRMHGRAVITAIAAA